MLEEVEAYASVAPSRHRKKKRGQLLYSTPKELSRSRMRRSNVMQHFTPDHVNTTRALDFQRTDLDEILYTSTYIHGDRKTLGNVHNHQVNSTSSVRNSFEGTSLIKLMLHITNNIQNETHCKT
jgi:hypothetical protein